MQKTMLNSNNLKKLLILFRNNPPKNLENWYFLTLFQCGSNNNFKTTFFIIKEKVYTPLFVRCIKRHFPLFLALKEVFDNVKKNFFKFWQSSSMLHQNGYTTVYPLQLYAIFGRVNWGNQSKLQWESQLRFSWSPTRFIPLEYASKF